MKVALVTGGSRGIGAETVKLFAQKGYTVLLNYNASEKKAESLMSEARSQGGDVHIFKADLSDLSQIEDMFHFVKKYFRRLDVLVNNAGVALTSLCQDVSESEYDRVMNVNAKAAFFCCARAVDMLRQSHGAIVNVSSVWGLKGAAAESVYSMSKFAVVGLTKSLAEELRPSFVRVNCVCPPMVETDMTKCYGAKDKMEFADRYGVNVYSAAQVAEDIYRLSQTRRTGVILSEK